MNYRAVAVLKIKSFFEIPESELDIINNYTYETDFKKYIEMIENYN
jgi:hypothetical protein